MDQKEFAQSIGYSDSAFSSIIKGKSGLSSDFVNILIEKYPNLNWNWLLTGKGEMELKENNIVLGDNHGTMQIHKIENPETELLLLRERINSLEKELKLKDQIIELLKK